jgi:PAS domain S-box-containing protein
MAMPAARAASGREGIMEGLDYRGVPVVAALRTIPDSPWSLVARMDTAEVYAPLREQLRLVVGLISALLLGAAGGVGLIWRQQRARYYRTKYEAAEARARLAAIVESSEDAIIGKSLDGTITSWNASAERLFGYRAEEMIGQPVTRLIPPDDQPWEAEILNRLRRGERVEHYEAVRLAKDGRPVAVSLTISPVLDAAGTIIGAAKIVRDITGLKRAGEMMRDLAARYRALFNESNDGMLVTDVETKTFKYANPAMCRMLGYTEDELRTMGMPDIHPQDALQSVIAKFEAQARGDKTLAEDVPCLRKDGSVIHTDISGAKITVDGRPCNVGFFRDITERKRAEEALRNSESMLNEMGRIAEVGGWEMDLLTRQAHWTKGTYDIVEISYGEPVPGPDEHVSYYLPEHRPIVESAMKKLIEEDIPLDFEAKLCTAKGNIKWCRALGQAVRKDGVCIKVYGTFQNITERKRAEEALRELAARYRALFNESTDGILIADIGPTTFKYANPALCRMLGYTEDELRTMGVPDIHPKETVPRVVAEFEALARGDKTLATDIPCLRKNGSVFHADVGAVKITVDGRPCNVGFFRDITERKRAEEALRTSEREFRSLAEAMPQIVWVTRADGWNIYFNQRWVDYTGLTLEESYGHGWNIPFHPDDRQRAWDAWQRATKHYDPYELECRLRRADGVYRWWLIRGVPLRNESGEILKWFGTCTDIEDLKQAEGKIQQLNAELEQRVRDRTADLEAANRELEAFSYSVSHDLRAPLRAMDGFSMALLEDCAGRLDETAQDHLRRIRAGSQQMAELIDDLLNLSRESRAEMRRERVDLTVLTHEIAAEFQRTHPDRKVQLVVAPALTADADARMLRLVFNNLLENAWKFTSRCAQARIEVGALEQDGQRIFFVRDNGVGFDMAYAGKLFGAFQRLHSSQEFAGTGIGLATVQRIIHRHGGRVWAEGAVGQGATFYFTLTSAEQTETR